MATNMQERRIIDTPESKLFVTGCTHLNHLCDKWENPLWKTRGYNSSQEMTEGIIDKINDTCSENDFLLVLGDFCLTTPWEKFLEDIYKIKPHLWFINGNHDNPWFKKYREFSYAKSGEMMTGVEWIQNKLTFLGPALKLTWNKQLVFCNHFAYQVWESSHRGSWSLCSHSHGSLETILPDYPVGKQLDCGWDVHRKPLSYEEIKKIMDKKKISFVDHHDKNTN